MYTVADSMKETVKESVNSGCHAKQPQGVALICRDYRPPKCANLAAVTSTMIAVRIFPTKLLIFCSGILESFQFFYEFAYLIKYM